MAESKRGSRGGAEVRRFLSTQGTKDTKGRAGWPQGAQGNTKMRDTGEQDSGPWRPWVYPRLSAASAVSPLAGSRPRRCRVSLCSLWPIPGRWRFCETRAAKAAKTPLPHRQESALRRKRAPRVRGAVPGVAYRPMPETSKPRGAKTRVTKNTK